MKPRSTFSVILPMILINVFCSRAQDKDLDRVLLEMGKDAAPGYLSPFMNTMGTGMNNGWHNSSKSLSFLGLPMGISVASMAFTIGQITDEMRTFDFKGDIPLRLLMDESLLPPGFPMDTLPEYITVEKNDVATIYGSDEIDSLTWGDIISQTDYPILYDLIFNDPAGPQRDPNENAFPLPFRGLVPGDWWGSLPNITAATVGLRKIPLIDNIQLGLSYVPTLERNVEGIGTMKFDFLSYKVQHEFTALIPVINKMKILHGSWYYAQNKLNLQAGGASMEMNNWVGMVNASVDLKFLFLGLGVFAGAGYESSSMSLEVAASDGLQGFSAEVPADRTLRQQIGARASLFMFDVWGEYNRGQINSYTLGITLLAFNGL
ncbi:DUF6588 family protein [Fibrobacterota bacterium]